MNMKKVGVKALEILNFVLNMLVKAVEFFDADHLIKFVIVGEKLVVMVLLVAIEKLDAAQIIELAVAVVKMYVSANFAAEIMKETDYFEFGNFVVD